MTGTVLRNDDQDRRLRDRRTAPCREARRKRRRPELVLATYRITGTAREHPGIQGTRTVTSSPVPGSDCSPSTTVYPATGEPAGVQP